MGDTGIPYVEKTVNAIIGCPDTGQSCLSRCWARELHDMRHKAYLAGRHVAPQYAKPFSELQILAERIEGPLHRKRPTTYLWNSTGDTFHEEVPFEIIDRMMAVVALTPQHRHLFLTKRVEREVEYFQGDWYKRILSVATEMPHHRDYPSGTVPSQVFKKNLYLGVSLMTQDDVDAKLAKHLQIPGKKWLSAEPLLSELDLWSPKYRYPDGSLGSAFGWGNGILWVVCGCEQYKRKPGRFEDGNLTDKYYEARWWAAARSIKEQCQAAGVPFWMKQGPVNGRVVTDLGDMPEDMRVRQCLK
jgi:protein gp37